MTRDNNTSVLEELNPDSQNLYFLFGGIKLGVGGMPPYEFYNSSKILDANKIFFRDFSQAWYQNGINGVGNDILEIRTYLEQKIKALNPQKVYFIGNSMGGYAAILFASMLGTGTVIAFAPQSFIDIEKRIKHLDYRWPLQIINTYLRSSRKEHVYDLQKWLTHHHNGFTANIYVSKNDRLDHLHAVELKDFANITIHEYNHGGHTLVRNLRDDGLLPKILNA